MKRSAAILGSTPPFIRWAICRKCPFRNADEDPHSLLTRFRGLQELSRGFGERRVVDGVCLHPENRPTALEQARGFLVSEVIDMFGGTTYLNETCGSCPANVPFHDSSLCNESSWAGCAGWVPGIMQGDIVMDRWDHIIQSRVQQGRRVALQTRPACFGFWARNRWTSDDESLPELAEVLHAIGDELWSKTEDRLAWQRLKNAVQRCLEHDMTLVTELVPQGYSDGVQWRLAAHCPRCKASMDVDQKYCPACRRQGGPHPPIVRKVLGLRPYSRLELIVGRDRTEQLIRQTK